MATFQHASERNPAFAFIGGDFDHRNPGTLTAKRQMFRELYDPNTLHRSGFVPLILQKMPIILNRTITTPGSIIVIRPISIGVSANRFSRSMCRHILYQV